MSFEPLQVNQVELDQTAFEALFNAPDGTPGADDIIGGAKGDPNPNPDGGEPNPKPAGKTDDANSTEGKMPEIKLDENIIDILAGGDGKSTNSTDPANPNAEPTNASGASADPNVLTNVQNFLIEKGLWADYEGREEVEMTDETFAEIAERQANFMANQKLKNVVEELPFEAQQMLRFIAKGGDPYQVAHLFLNRQNVVNMKPQTLDEKQKYIESYYKTLNWNDSRIKSHLDRIKAGGEMGIEEEFKDVQPLYQQHYDQKLAAAEQAAEKQKADEAERVQMFEDNVTSALESRQDLTQKDKEFVFDTLLNYDQQLPDGRRVNKFFVAFAQAQNDLNAYIDLALYLTDRKKFEQRIIERHNTGNVKKSFDFMRSSGTTNTPKSSSKPAPKQVGTNFSFLT